MAAVEAENCGKLGPGVVLPFAGNVDIWADHAGAFACGGAAESPVFAVGWLTAIVSPGGSVDSILSHAALRPIRYQYVCSNWTQRA